MRMTKDNFRSLCRERSYVLDGKTGKSVKTDYGKILDVIDKTDEKSKTKLKKLMKKINIK